MSKEPSAETKLKTLRRNFNNLRRNCDGIRQARDQYRARATQAEQDAAEWKRRFDTLLTKIEDKP